MFIAVARISFALFGAHSLKDKRSIVKKLVKRTRARFDVAIAEVDEQDRWQNAVIGVSLVGSDSRKLESVLDQVLGFMDELFVGERYDTVREVMSFGERY